MRIKLTKAQQIRVLNSVDVYEVMQRILLRENKIDLSKEHFWVVCLSQANKIVGRSGRATRNPACFCML